MKTVEPDCFTSDVYGADGQRMIYAHNPKHPWPRMRNYGTKTTDGRFIYAEFMARASGSSMLADRINWDIRSPLGVGIKDALDDLAKHNIGGGTMDVAEASPDLRSWNPPHDDAFKTNFVELYERALKTFRQFSLDPDFNTLIGKNRRDVVTQLISQIYMSRREESMNWVAEFLQKKYPDIVAPETASAVEGRKPYKKVSIEASLAAYTDADGRFTGAFGKDFSNRAAFIFFVSDLTGYAAGGMFSPDLALYLQCSRLTKTGSRPQPAK